MKVFKIILFGLVMAALGGLIVNFQGRQKTENISDEPDWVLKIGNSYISPEDFQAEWERLTRLRQKLPSRQEVVDQLYQEWIGYEAARSSGFMETESMQREIRRLVSSAYKKELIRREREEVGDPDLSENSLRAEFEASKAEWTQPARYLVGWLPWSVPEKGSEEKREENLTRLANWREAVAQHNQPRQKFAELCRLHSEDPTTRYFGGELGWKSEDQLRRELGDSAVDALVKLKETGEVTEVIEFPGRAAFFQLRGYAASQVRPFAEVQPALRDRRIREVESRIDTAVQNDLESRVLIQTDPAKLEKLKAPEFVSPESQAPAPMAGS